MGIKNTRAGKLLLRSTVIGRLTRDNAPDFGDNVYSMLVSLIEIPRYLMNESKCYTSLSLYVVRVNSSNMYGSPAARGACRTVALVNTQPSQEPLHFPFLSVPPPRTSILSPRLLNPPHTLSKFILRGLGSAALTHLFYTFPLDPRTL